MRSSRSIHGKHRDAQFQKLTRAQCQWSRTPSGTRDLQFCWETANWKMWWVWNDGVICLRRCEATVQVNGEIQWISDLWTLIKEDDVRECCRNDIEVRDDREEAQSERVPQKMQTDACSFATFNWKRGSDQSWTRLSISSRACIQIVWSQRPL